MYTDGGSRGNPGPAGVGVVIINGAGKKVATISKYIGRATNNQAEYQALIKGLEKLQSLGAREVEIVMDSELIVKQLNQEYKVKNKDLAPLFVRAWNILSTLKKYSVRHTVREHNTEADALVNKALDNASFS